MRIELYKVRAEEELRILCYMACNQTSCNSALCKKNIVL